MTSNGLARQLGFAKTNAHVGLSQSSAAAATASNEFWAESAAGAKSAASWATIEPKHLQRGRTLRRSQGIAYAIQWVRAIPFWASIPRRRRLGTEAIFRTLPCSVLIDPGLQEANTAVHGQSSHPIENDSSRGQTQGSTPLLAHLSSLGNAQQAHPDQAGSRRLSQQAVHDNSRQSQMPTSLGAQDVVIQNMVMANAQGNSTDNTRQNPTLGTVSTNTQRAPPTAQQHYSHFPQPQQRAQQFQVSQTSWEGDMASRRTSNEAQHLNADRRTGLKYTPSSGGTDGAYSTSNSDGRLRNSHSSGQPTGQPLSNTSPISVVASMSHLNHSGSQAGPVSGSIPRDNTNPQWQLSHMNIRLDQLAKTQAEMLAYLHVELTRRKEWEEQLLKELRQRREQASATRTSHNEHAGPVGPQDVRWNNMARNSFAGNPMELIGNPPFPASHNLPIAGGQGNYTAWSHPQNAPQVSTSGNPSVFNPLVPPNQSRPTIESTNPFPASASQQPHSQSLSAMTLSVNGINGYSHEAEQKQEQSRGAVATLPNFSEVTQSKPSQAELNQVGLTSLPSLPLYVESDNTATAPAAAEEAERTKRKRKADGETGTERPSKKLEVDERGVVIMMSGNTKLKEKPTKIQVSRASGFLQAHCHYTEACCFGCAVCRQEDLVWIHGDPGRCRCKGYANIRGRNATT